ncbi:phage regulatory CII family protein [Pseudogulbenkiania ferrooxidans]|uniref:Uncharacterized protein n=1 Tax=Pseudogulbenkiania ferrooxidans 2002 TaxID=279714 RepID=B9Z4X8_9NEIS|nr:phage regulatory CII family protein [Pseudogulbenkiania ferrooxidans]EEG08210.1 hypothetical protein FuraDRAFT_2413 [Pseudogulbenkiania ferrooxidans 2002]
MEQSIDVFEELQQAAHAFGVPKLAGLMKVHKGTLYNKVSLKKPNALHKPTLSDFIQILDYSRNLRPLKALNSLFNCVTYQLPDMSNVSDEALLDLVNQVHVEAGEAHRSMGDALDDGVVTLDEFKTVERDLHDWIAAILELRSRFKGLVIHAAQ